MSKMRVVALILMHIHVVAIYLHGAEGIKFDLKDASKETYTNFIEELRTALHGPTNVIGIPVLRPRGTVPASQRYLLVDLYNYDSLSITLALDVENVYVVGYRADDQSFFFQDTPESASSGIFPGTSVTRLDYNGSYTALERRGRQSRENTELTARTLDNAITQLRLRNNEGAVARSFLVVIQMVSEAARFRLATRRIADSIHREEGEGYFPGNTMLSLENSWERLSIEMQRANEGVFVDAVMIRDASNQLLAVESFQSPAVLLLGLLLYVCNTRDTATSTISDIISNTGTTIMMNTYSNIVGPDATMVDDGDDQCTVKATTRRIQGRDGLCVDVRNGQVNNGNPVQLLECTSTLEPKQQWTIETDGTIRSMGSCLTISDIYSSGSYVMVYNCESANPDAKMWKIWKSGSISNPRTGLVLTATSSASGTTLTAEDDVHAARQCWRVADQVTPIVAHILGYQGMCMEGNTYANSVSMRECDSDKVLQDWVLFPDNTIRVYGDRDLCVTSDGHSSLDLIFLRECGGWGNQRWWFTPDGTIMHLNSTLFMDVNEDHKITLYPPTGGANQQWLPLF